MRLSTGEQVSAGVCDVVHGDCLAHLRSMPDNSVDAVVTDPPYGLSNTTPDKVADTIVRWASGDRDHVPEGRGFMGRPWDAFVPPPAVWDECLRVLKPGGHMVVFAGSRTQDLMGLSIRLAGFELRDSLAWIYGSGMPKSLDVSRSIDKVRGNQRGTTPDTRNGPSTNPLTKGTGHHSGGWGPQVHVDTGPVDSDAARWEGWGTALKPAQEPIILARKPLEGTVAANVLAHGVGGLNIDACRVPTDWSTDPTRRGWQGRNLASESGVPFVDHNKAESQPNPSGRFPANVLLDEHAATEMDKQSGVSVSTKRLGRYSPTTPTGNGVTHGKMNGIQTDRGVEDSGGASRFFPVFKYQAKAPKRERPVIYFNECECDQWQSQPKDTAGSTSMGEQSWSTSTSGNNTTGQSQKATTSTTSTTTNSTIGSRTCSASAGSSTSASTQGASCVTESGGSPAGCAESSSQSKGTTGISAPKGGPSMADAGSATSPRWYTTSECESCGEQRRRVSHCTVKPLALMSWLVTLITPPGGVVLDPFAGSGTTLEAARDKGFRAVGIEADADHVALIHERLKQESGEPDLFTCGSNG